MLTLYIVCAVLGLAFAILAAVGAEFGHHELGDAHIDVGGTDLDGDGTPDVMTWIPFLSLRFWTYFLAAFGATGFLLERFATVPSGIITGIAAATGLIAGLSVAILVRSLRRHNADSMTRSSDMIGATATVLVPIRKGQTGQIRCEMKGEIIDFMAISEGDEDLLPGVKVIVTGIENDRAAVIPLSALYEGDSVHLPEVRA
jgi:membrane protein implicated in regulation of membrane protease activity